MSLSFVLRGMLAAAAVLVAAAALAQGRLAFVVGIDTYANLTSEMQLSRAVADAETVGDTLSALNFKVTRLTRAVTQETLLKRFDDFRKSIAPGDTVVFFFAGHGIGLENANYLIPADVPLLTPENELLVRSRAVAEGDLIALIRERRAGVTMMVIDACRNNPFPTRTGVRGTETIGMKRGLAVKEPPQGVLSIYSAGFGELALDRLSADDANANSVFTRVFVEQLKKPGVSIVELAEAVRDDVATLADSVRHQQVPAVYNQIRGARGIFLAGAPPATPPVAPQQQSGPGADEIAWSILGATRDEASRDAFIARFPSSPRKAEAEKRLVDIRATRFAALPPVQALEAKPKSAERPDIKVDFTSQAVHYVAVGLTKTGLTRSQARWTLEPGRNPTLRADVEFPGEGVTLSVLIDKSYINIDPIGAFSHTMRLKFGRMAGTSPPIVRAVKTPELKTGFDHISVLLDGKVSLKTDFFLVGLGNAPAAREKNLGLLRKHVWLDIPFNYVGDDTRRFLSIEMTPSVKQALEQVLKN